MVTDSTDADWWEGYLEADSAKAGFFLASFVELM